MTTARPGLFAGAWQAARVELTELRSSPGLYLFAPLILLQTLGPALIAVGFLDTPILVTSGTFAVSTMGTLTTCLWLLCCSTWSRPWSGNGQPGWRRLPMRRPFARPRSSWARAWPWS